MRKTRMAEQFIEELYGKADILTRQKRILQYELTWDAHMSGRLWNQSVSDLLMIEELFSSDDKKADFRNKVTSVSEFLSCRDLCAAADIHRELIHLLEELFSTCNAIDVTEGHWQLFGTKSGYLSLRELAKMRLVHSAIDPMEEAFHIARRLLKSVPADIYLFGAGLGYLPYQLWKESFGTTKIHLYEPEAVVVEYAKQFGMLSYIPEENLQVISGMNPFDLLLEFSKTVPLQEPVYFISEYASIYFEGEEAILFRSVYENYNTVSCFYEIKETNRRANLRRPNRNPEEVLAPNKGKECVVIAPGPSLDDSIEFIRASKGERTLISVGPAWKRLQKEGIVPEYIVLVDPFMEVYQQLEGAEEGTEDIVLLALPTVCWKYIADFRGSIAYLPEEDEKWNSCGTVTGMAISAALHLDAPRIYFAGADMGYPSNRTYASGTSHTSKQVDRGEVQVVSVTGEMIWTTRAFDTFRVEIERMLSNYPMVQFVNLSKGGAHIAGTLEGKWWEKAPNDSVEAVDYLRGLCKESGLTMRQKYGLFRKVLHYLEEKEDGFGGKTSETTSSFLAEKKALLSTLSADYCAEFGEEFVRSVKATVGERIYKNGSIPAGKGNGGPAFLFVSGCRKDTAQMKRLGEMTAKLTSLGKNVVIVNTLEDNGRCNVATGFSMEPDYVAEQLLYAENVDIHGKRFPYFSFSGEGLDVTYAKTFLQSLCNSKPDMIVFADPDSLLANILC